MANVSGKADGTAQIDENTVESYVYGFRQEEYVISNINFGAVERR